MTTANLDEHDLRTDVTGSDFINEDVLQQISQIDQWDHMMLGMIGRDDVSKSFSEWTTIERGTQDLSNAAIDGADITGNDTKLGERVGNHVQIFTKRVPVSYGAITSDTIGRANERAFQLAQRMYDIATDVEGVLCGNQASVAPTESVAGQMGSLGSWIESPTSDNGATGADGGYNFSTKVVDQITIGTPRALTQTLIEETCQAMYEAGSNPSYLMSTPTMMRRLSTFMFDASNARVATLQGDTSADSGTAALTAKAAVNVFVTSFDVVLMFKSNRDQPNYGDFTLGGTADEVDVFLMDPDMMRLGVQRGLQAERQGITGLAENWQLSWYLTLKVLNRKSQGVIRDCQSDQAVTA